MTKGSISVQLKAETLGPFDAYIQSAESAMNTNSAGQAFLWSDAVPERARDVGRGKLLAEFWSGNEPLHVPSGLIHDWIGVAFIPAVTARDVLALVQNYDNHKNIYRPEVIASRLISRIGNDFQIYLRLLKHKIITVVLDTYHTASYHHLDNARWTCRSCTTRISEVENAGGKNEIIQPPDTGHGFLWRLNSYWRFLERDGGVHVQCRAISLTRDVPFGMGWVIEPIVQKLPRESLINTLEATRRAMGHKP